MATQYNGVVLNKLTLAQFRSAKASNSLSDSETYVITDIDEYLDSFVQYKECLDASNPIILRNLESGLYKVYGYYKYYSSQSGISGVDPYAFIMIDNSGTTTYATIIDSSTTIRVSITDSSYTDLNDSGWITLNDYIKYRKVGKHVYIKGTTTYGTSLGTLPSGYRPIDTNHVFLVAGSGTYYAKARVTTTGVISLLGHTGTSTTSYEIETSFPTN